MSRPQSLGEWAEYIKHLAGEPLYSQAVAANSQAFSQMLLEEGATMADVEQVMLLFVRQLRATGTKVPEGGPWDLVTMALTDPEARKGPTMSEKEAEFLATTFKSGTDDFDMFELEAGFED
jgi:hypothetical protein